MTLSLRASSLGRRARPDHRCPVLRQVGLERPAFPQLLQVSCDGGDGCLSCACLLSWTHPLAPWPLPSNSYTRTRLDGLKLATVLRTIATSSRQSIPGRPERIPHAERRVRHDRDALTLWGPVPSLQMANPSGSTPSVGDSAENRQLAAQQRTSYSQRPYRSISTRSAPAGCLLHLPEGPLGELPTAAARCPDDEQRHPDGPLPRRAGQHCGHTPTADRRSRPDDRRHVLPSIPNADLLTTGFGARGALRGTGDQIAEEVGDRNAPDQRDQHLPAGQNRGRKGWPQ